MARKKKNLGNLKLPEPEATQFVEALGHYGYDSTPSYLRRMALMLIKHHERRDKLIQPPELKTHQNAAGKPPGFTPPPPSGRS